MNNNPFPQQGIEFNKPTNEVAGLIEAREQVIHTGVALAARALMVDPAMRRLMYEQANKPINPAPAPMAEISQPTATEMLTQAAANAATVPAQNLLETDSDNPEVMADNLRTYIDTLHEGERNAA